MNLSPDSLNADCTCVSLDRSALGRALELEMGDAEFSRRLTETHPTLISSLPVFIRAEHARRMAEIIASKSALTLKIGKRAFYEQAEMPLAAAYDHATRVMVENMLARDAEEGIGAFVEKRQPVWEDR